MHYKIILFMILVARYKKVAVAGSRIRKYVIMQIEEFKALGKLQLADTMLYHFLSANFVEFIMPLFSLFYLFTRDANYLQTGQI